MAPPPAAPGAPPYFTGVNARPPPPPTMAEPGAGSFKNLEPLSREERLAARNKDALEKNRIAARQGGQNGGGVRLPPVQNPISPVKNSALYIEEYDRFNRDVAGELHRKKLEAIQKREVSWEAH